MDNQIESLDDGSPRVASQAEVRVGSVWRSYRQRARPHTWVYLGTVVYMSRGKVPHEVTKHVWARVQQDPYRTVDWCKYDTLEEAFRVLEPVGD